MYCKAGLKFKNRIHERRVTTNDIVSVDTLFLHVV